MVGGWWKHVDMSHPAASPHEADDAVLDDVVTSLVQIEAAISALEAERFRQLARAHAVAAGRSVHRPRSVQEREIALRSIAAEVGVALRWHDRTAQRRITEAGALVEDFPATVTALDEAKITARHAEVIREVGEPLLEPESRQEFERRVLTRAERDTVAGTRAFAQAVAQELEPRSITERHDDAVDRRRVWVDDDIGRPAIDPTHAHLPGGLGAIRAEVSVVIPVLTAVGASERGAMLDGCAPVDADTARHLFAEAPG